MTSDMYKFVKFKNHDGGIVIVDKNVTYHIIGIGSITLDGKTDTNDVYFVDGLKHNVLNVGQLVDKFKFTKKTYIIKDTYGNLI